MTPYPHQVELADQAFNILKQFGLVYLACEERTGKTLAAILTAEKCPTIKTVLVVTKKGKMRLQLFDQNIFLRPLLLAFYTATRMLKKIK